jgi:hypothetical protein
MNAAVKRARSLLLLGAAAFSGCAAWNAHGVAVRPPRKLRVAILPITQDFKLSKLSSIETIPKGLDPSTTSQEEQKKMAEKAMAADLIWLRRSLGERFSRTYAYEVVPDSEALTALQREGLSPESALWELKPAKMKSLAQRMKADVILKSRLDGYGKLKSLWLAGVMTADYAENGVTGFAVAAASGNPWAGIGTGVLETVLDTVKWIGALWFTNRLFVPVILKGELVSGADGRGLASNMETEMSFEIFGHDKAFDKYPLEQRKLKQVRLKAVAEKAIDDMAVYFDGQALKNEGGFEEPPRS